MTIKFLKIRNVKSPTRAYEFDAGIDFYVPEFNEQFVDDLYEKNPQLQDHPLTILQSKEIALKLKEMKVPAHSRVMIPSGIKSRMAEPGRALIAANKSGVATKHGLVYGAQVVDYTYKGEIHLSLINSTNQAVYIQAGQKILQFLETPVFNSPVEIVEMEKAEDEQTFYKGLQDDRGAGGFGSTDKNRT